MSPPQLPMLPLLLPLLLPLALLAAGPAPASAHARLRVSVWRPVQELTRGTGPGGVIKRQLSCNCVQNVCSCCAPLALPQTPDTTACVQLTFQPQDLALTLNVLVNGNSIYETSISGKNPPPLCVSLPQVPFIQLCVRLTDVGLYGTQVQACPTLEVQVASKPVLAFDFDCVHVGSAGISVVPRPSASGSASAAASVSASDEYDEIQQ